MLLRSLQGRLLMTFVTLMILGLGGVIVLSGWRLTAQSLERSQRDLELQSQIIANALREPVNREEHSEQPAGRSLDALLGSYATSIGGRVTLVDAQTNVLLSSDSTVPVGVKEDQSELATAQNGKSQSAIRWDEWRKEERLFVATPIVGEHGRAFGFVQLSVPTAPIYADLQQTWLTFFSIGGVVLLVTIGASMLVARQIAVPVQNLTRTSEQIAAGHLDERVSPAGPDEVRRLGVVFNQMVERVQEMMGQQRAFVDNAAHELRSPLTSLRLHLEMLQAHGQNDAELTRRYLGQMEREIGYLQRLTNHLLVLASVDEQTPAAREPIDLAHLLYEIADSVNPIVQQDGLTLKIDVPEHLPHVHANVEQMNMMIRNLLDNAIKYTRAGGTITLTAKSVGREIEICTTDTGTGIPTNALPHIFDRFYRVDPARSRQQGGAGLGLALVRSIAEAHGGRVAVSSRVNEGSTFTIHLPIAAQT